MSSVTYTWGPSTITVTESMNVPHGELNHSFKGGVVVGRKNSHLGRFSANLGLKHLLF